MTDTINSNDIIIDDVAYGDIDELEYGITSQNQLTIDNNIQDDEKFNPFYVSQKGGNINTISWGDIHRNFNSVIILTASKINKPINIDKLFQKVIKKTDLQTIKNVTYFRTGLNILKNRDHYYKSVLINKSDLLELFSDDKTFNEIEIVLSIFEMDEENTRKYCDMYRSTEDISNVHNKLDIYKYYLSDKKNIDKLQIDMDKLFKNLKENNYWADNANLDINITNSFIDREFNNQRFRDKSKFVVITDKNNQNNNQNNNTQIIKSGSVNYPIDNDLNNANNNTDNVDTKIRSLKKDRHIFVDPSAIIRCDKSAKKRTFFSTIIDDSKITNDYIINLYNDINNDRMKYMFVNNLLLSKEYCHLVINNIRMLDLITPMINKYKHVFKYSIGYAWLNLYLEECLARTKSHKKSRFTFDIHTANKLPVFPYIYNDLKQNPYITLLIDDMEILTDNLYGLSYIDGYDGYGVTDLTTFKKRINIFSSGNPDIDPFNGIDWTKFAVSGSAITACLQKKSVLLDQLIKQNNNDENEGFKAFIKKYYVDSDIDLMSNEKTIVKFLESVDNVYNLLKTNLNATDKDMRFESVKSLGISITKYFFEYYLTEFNNAYGLSKTLEEFESMTDDILFKTFIYTKYIIAKGLSNKKLLSEHDSTKSKLFLSDYMIPNSYENMNIYRVDHQIYDNYDIQDNDVVYYRNDYGNSFIHKENYIVMKISENIRYKLFCKNTKIETFRIRDNEFFNTVAKFHFPCVRAYYQGDNVYILPSCVTAMMTGFNIEYKYFAGIRNPVDIINKYVFRGFGVLLNKYEINLWLEYNKTNKDTQIKYSGNDNDKKQLLGYKTVDNTIYGLTNTSKYNNILTTTDDINNYYKKFNTSSCINFSNIRTINKNGNINKLYTAYIELCYDEMN